MDRVLLADFIVNFCGAVGVLIALLVFRARDPQGALTRRFTVPLGLIALFFLLRGLSWVSGWPSLGRFSVLLAAFVPLAVLVVVEAMLRQHAPRIIKIGVLFGGVAIGLVALFLPYAASSGLHLVLAAFQVTAFAACGFLLLTPPPGSLGVTEMRDVRRLCLAAFFLVPFIITDFRAFFPEFPVRLGALGTLIVVLAALLGNRAGEQKTGQGLVFVIRVAGALGASGLVSLIVPGLEAGDVARLAAVTLSCVLLIGLVGDVARAITVSGQPGLLQSVAVSRAGNREALIEELRGQPLFDNAVRLRETDLAQYDPDILRPALIGHVVVRRAGHPWGTAEEAPATERLHALLAAYDASHLIVVDTEPLDLIALRVPLLAADRATETALLMAGRLLAARPVEAGR